MTAAERDRQTFPKVDEPRRQHSSSDDIGFVTEEIREELRTKVGLSEADIARGGFKIITTIDQDAQQAAAKAVDDARPEGSSAKDVHIGLAAVEPGDGAVRAMYGGSGVRTGPLGLLQRRRRRQDAGRLDDEALHDHRRAAGRDAAL